MRTKQALLPLAFATALAALHAPAHAVDVMKGYVCAVSRTSITAGRRGDETALLFNLTSEPACEGTWLRGNYVCGTGPRARLNIGLCSKATALSLAEQAMLQEQLLFAAGRNLPVDVVRGPCLDEDPVETCFVSARILNIPAAAGVATNEGTQ